LRQSPAAHDPTSPVAGTPTDVAERRRQIVRLALPITAAMLSQNVLNLVDTFMVGSLGDAALAAVGMGGALNYVTSAAVLGLSAGVQATAARRLGEGKHGETAIPLNGGLLLAVALAVPWSLLLVGLTPLFYPFFNDDPVVLRDAVPYLQVRLLAMTAMGMNFSFRGYWNATGRPVVYMSTLVVMHVLNVLLNWVLIYGNLGAPALGTVGAGIASAIATWVGTCLYFSLAWRLARVNGFLRSVPRWDGLVAMMRLSGPMSVQQVFLAGGITAFFWIAGSVGTAELAATHVLVHLLLVGLLPSMGFGFASASLVGHALGRGDPKDAMRWGWEVARMATGVVVLIALPAVLFPHAILGAFIHAPDTLAMAVTPLRLVGVFLAADAVGMVLMHSMVGAGDTRRTMIISIALQWGLFLPVAYLVGPVLGGGLVLLWATNVTYRVLQACVFSVMWLRGGWAGIEV
jgi:multidrug resistance protein, MATE family